MQTTASNNPKTPEVTCERCGRLFGCNAGGDCWCAAESYRLPMPDDGSGCLCPACLRKAAAEQKCR